MVNAYKTSLGQLIFGITNTSNYEGFIFFFFFLCVCVGGGGGGGERGMVEVWRDIDCVI